MPSARGPRPLPLEPWMTAVAELMVHEDMTFSLACQSLGRRFATAEEERKYETRVSFQDLLNETENRYFERIGANPSLIKPVAIGRLVKAIRRMDQAGQFDKIPSAVDILSKVAGWTKNEQPISVLATMSQSELDEVRKKIREMAAVQQAQDPDSKKLN